MSFRSDIKQIYSVPKSRDPFILLNRAWMAGSLIYITKVLWLDLPEPRTPADILPGMLPAVKLFGWTLLGSLGILVADILCFICILLCRWKKGR